MATSDPVDGTLRFIAQQGWRSSDEDFLPALVRHLGDALAMEYVFVGRLLPGGAAVETVAFYADGKMADTVSYELVGTPCEEVVHSTLCHFDQGIQNRFPADRMLVDVGAESYVGIPLWDSGGDVIGLLVALGREPLADRDLVVRLLQVVASRSAVELERHLSAAEIRHFEDRFRNLFNHSTDAIYLLDSRELKIVDANPAAAKMLGYDRETLRSMSALDLHSAERHDWVRSMIASRLEGNKGVVESVHQRSDGTLVPVEVAAQAVGDGEDALIQAFVRDVSSRKVAEDELRRLYDEAREAREALAQERDRADFYLNNVDAIILALDADGCITEINRSGCELLGFPKEDLLGRNWFDTCLPEDVSGPVHLFFLEMLRGEQPVPESFENLVRTREGELLHVLWRNTRIRDEEDRVVGILSVGQDVSARRQEEAEREGLRRLLSMTSEMARVGGWQLEIDSRRLQWSEETYRIHEVGPEFVPDVETAIGFYTPESRPKIRAAVERAIREGESYDLELEIETTRGNLRWIQTLGEVQYRGGRPWALAGTIQDITERTLLRQERERLAHQLAQSQRVESLGRLAGGIAHDFNNMLSVILGQVDLAKIKAAPETPLLAQFDVIEEAASRSADLTRQLLAFARKQTILPRALDLNGKISETLTMLHRVIGEHIELVWQPGEVPWQVEMDPGQIDQILTNLCLNARDAIDDVGRITITTENFCVEPPGQAPLRSPAPGDYVLLTVADTGRGIESRDLEKIFEPFFTTKSAGLGSGLGLATVFGIVKQNHGFIYATSELGRGTTFSLYLPRHDGSSGVQEQEQITEPEGGRETLLLVEDEPFMLETARDMLSALGYQVLVAGSPTTAVDLYRKHSDGIDLLVTDVIMPEMNGRQLADRLRAENPSLRTLFTSGYTADIVDKSGVLERGMHFLRKPYSLRSLALSVREALGSTR